MRDSSGPRRAREADAVVGRVKLAARRTMTRRIVVGCRILVCHRLLRKLGTPYGLTIDVAALMRP